MESQKPTVAFHPSHQAKGRWEADERQPLGSSGGEVTGKVTELKAFKWPN